MTDPVPLPASVPTEPNDTTLSAAAPRLQAVTSVPPLHGRVAQHAHAVPEVVALAKGTGAASEVMSYPVLEAKANQVANYLISLGLKLGDPVGVCTRRSFHFAICTLGILKAGGAYLPLDPTYPDKRLRFMAEQAQVPFVLAEQRYAPQLSDGNWQVIALEGEASVLDRQPAAAPQIEVSQDDLAYVIYTSGSTGQPKGVEITHRGLTNLVDWHIDAFGVTAADRASQVSNLGFDAAGWEIWPYLAVGASVHFADETTRSSPELLRDWLVANQISIGFVPTPIAECMFGLTWPSETQLRYLLTGGDVLQHFPPPGLPFTVVNNYGPTECTVVATSGIVNPERQGRAAPSIGRPIPSAHAYILDEELKRVPLGAPGELYIGGPGVARGYRNLPELTAQRFIVDPFRDVPDARLYKTGDQVRCSPTGEIEFIGRLDEQIKIRGYRIEPNEISGVLNQYDAISTSVVIARTDDGEAKRLVGYVAAKAGAALDDRNLRAHLRRSLPEYMVPSVFVRLAALPLTPNGKLDRAALPVPDATNTLAADTTSALQTDTQQRLAALLSKLLDVHEIGPVDNFFLLGGHSLLGAQLIAKVRQSFGVELSLISVFDRPTVAEISAEIDHLASQKQLNVHT